MPEREKTDSPFCRHGVQINFSVCAECEYQRGRDDSDEHWQETLGLPVGSGPAMARDDRDEQWSRGVTEGRRQLKAELDMYALSPTTISAWHDRIMNEPAVENRIRVLYKFALAILRRRR